MPGAACGLCSEGEYSLAGQTKCSECPQATYSTAIGATRSDVCLPCTAGTSTSGQAGAHKCSKCEAGTYAVTDSAECTKCVKGRYSPTFYATHISTCKICQPGKYSDAQGAPMCKPCPQGTGVVSGARSAGECGQCAPGKSADGSGKGCLPCPAGSGTNTGVTRNNQFSCGVCPAGFFSNGTGAPCTKCSTNAYSATGAAKCRSCPEGRTSPSGAITCQAKPCDECPANTKSTKATQLNGCLAPGDVCVSCPYGQISSPNSVQCHLCPVGFSISNVTHRCDPCLSGTYSDTPGSVVCKPCPRGSFCPVGSAIPLKASPTLKPDAKSSYYARRGSKVVTAVHSRQASLTMVEDAKVDSKNRQLALLGAIFCLLVAAAALLTFVSGHVLRMVDFLFASKHNLSKDDLHLEDLYHRTPLGGRFTFYLIIVIAGAVMMLSLPLVTDANFSIHQSFAPVTGSDDIKSNIKIVVEAIGLSNDHCQKISLGNLIIDENALVSTVGTWAIASKFDRVEGTCIIGVESPTQGFSAVADSKMLLKLGGYPAQLRISITSISALPDQASTVSVAMAPPNGTMMTANATVVVELLAESYTCLSNSTARFGYMALLPRGKIDATVATAPVSVAEDTLTLELSIWPSTTVQKTSVSEVQTWATFISLIASTMVAILGGMAFVFKYYEKYVHQEFCSKEGAVQEDSDQQGPAIEMASMDTQTLSLAELQAGLQQVRERLAQTASPEEVKNTVRDMLAQMTPPSLTPEDPTIEMATMHAQYMTQDEVRTMLAQTVSPSLTPDMMAEVRTMVRDMMAEWGEKPQEPPPTTPAQQPLHTQLEKPEEATMKTSPPPPTMGEASEIGQETHLVQV